MADKIEEAGTLKRKRRIDPLKTKTKKLKIIKTIDEINKPSKGEELLQTLVAEQKPTAEESEPISKPPVAEESEPISKPSNYTSMIKDGVEVVDVKAILEEASKKKLEK